MPFHSPGRRYNLLTYMTIIGQQEQLVRLDTYGIAHYEYNDKARLERVETSISAASDRFVTSHSYDLRGRPSTTTYPSALKAERGYSSRGYLETLKDATSVQG